MITLEKILSIRRRLNSELAPMSNRELHVNSEINLKKLTGPVVDANMDQPSRYLGFDIKYSPKIDVESYEVWIDKVRYII